MDRFDLAQDRDDSSVGASTVMLLKMREVSL